MQTPSSATRRQFLSSCGFAAGAALTGSAFVGNAFGQATQLAMRAAEVPANHVLTPAIRVGTDAIRKAAAINDYTASFSKKEMVGKVMKAGRMEIKIRHQPFSIYMKFVEPNAGRELIYMDGAYAGSLKVHETGFAAMLGTLSIDPNGSMAMAEARYPVTMMGVKTMAEKVVEQWVSETARTQPKVQYYPNAKLGTTSCRAIESTHARPMPGVTFHKTRLFIAVESGLPVRVQQFDFAPTGQQPVLLEDYAYFDVKTNVGLTNADFDIRNPAYSF